MDLQTISQVSRSFGVSTRTLRYYEQIGLLESSKLDGYAYRTYDQSAILRLQQIIVLRKLRIPLKKIAEILENHDAMLLLEVFQQSVAEVEEEMYALSSLRAILRHFASRLAMETGVKADLSLLESEEFVQLVTTLSPSKTPLKEEQKMEDLNRASQTLNKLQDRDVRILYLPPATVAAAHFIGDDPEDVAGGMLSKFAQESNLAELKPDARSFGFNHPSECPDHIHHGYEVWVTIPDDMEVPAPLEKKRMPGGLYAAHCIKMGDFHEWEWLMNWVFASPQYEEAHIEDGGECMCGLLEEHLNWLQDCSHGWPETSPSQLDLLYPIRIKSKEK